MKKTLFSHFYNEEYLLPWWLKHHRELFDHGVMVNYASTDSSVEIIRELCPTWDIVDSVNSDFDATKVESEMNQYESLHSGWKMILNTTEFLIGDMTILDDNQSCDHHMVRCHIMVDKEEYENIDPDPDKSLLITRTNGINTLENWGQEYSHIRHCRVIHNSPAFQYPTGRHFAFHTTDRLHVLWYGFSPFTERLLQRKLQIKNRIPEDNVKMEYGVQHMYSREKMIEEMKKFQASSMDMSYLINQYVA